MAAIQAAALLLLLLTVTHARALAPVNSRHPEAHPQASNPAPPQETGFLNRAIEIHGISYKFQVYIPEELHRPAPLDAPIDDRKPRLKKLESPPIILFLHGLGERGSEGMWQTQIGLAQQLRDHPERWPFIVVMPQCPFRHFWTDPDMLQMAMATLEQEQHEFHADLDRTYLIGLSLGGYGAWELARANPHRWAAIAICASGIFWSYAPERWQEVATLPAEYARPLGRTPIWLFHGADDPVVAPRESELMFEALKAAGGHVRYWLYQGLKHDCWSRAYDEPELPRWLLAHHIQPSNTPPSLVAELPPLAEKLVIPFHPPAIKLPPPVLDSLAGEYLDKNGHPVITIFRQADQIYEKNLQGEIAELAAESPGVFFYVNGSSTTRLTFEHDAQGRVTTLLLKDDRHEERWEKRTTAGTR
jgi:predicted esterase